MIYIFTPCCLESGKQTYAGFESLKTEISLSTIHGLLFISQKLEKNSTMTSCCNTLTRSFTAQWQYAYASHIPSPTQFLIAFIQRLPCIPSIISAQPNPRTWENLRE